MKRMPQDLFCDFACNLSEYALNREPDLFFSTHFWHDLFHSITHLCGPNFKSGRVLGLEGINTEISEWLPTMCKIHSFSAFTRTFNVFHAVLPVPFEQG